VVAACTADRINIEPSVTSDTTWFPVDRRAPVLDQLTDYCLKLLKTIPFIITIQYGALLKLEALTFWGPVRSHSPHGPKDAPATWHDSGVSGVELRLSPAGRRTRACKIGIPVRGGHLIHASLDHPLPAELGRERASGVRRG